MRKSLPLAALILVAAFVPAACSKSPAVPSVSLDAGIALGVAEGGAPMGSAMPSSSAAHSGSGR